MPASAYLSLQTHSIFDGMLDLERMRKEGRVSLSEGETKLLLRQYGIPTTDFRLPSREELNELDIDFPIAIKVSSAKVIHKTEVGGLFLNVPDRKEMIKKYDLIKSRFPGADVLVEPMEKGGVEVIIGLLDDGTFGHSIMFGIGGILTELYRDVTFRSLPINDKDAEEMVNEIKGAKLLQGFRGIKTDREALLSTILKVGRMGFELKEHINQLDLNPVLVRENGCVAVDAKLVLEPISPTQN